LANEANRRGRPAIADWELRIGDSEGAEARHGGELKCQTKPIGAGGRDWGLGIGGEVVSNEANFTMGNFGEMFGAWVDFAGAFFLASGRFRPIILVHKRPKRGRVVSCTARKQRTEEKGGVETTGEGFSGERPQRSRYAGQGPWPVRHRAGGGVNRAEVADETE